MNVEEKVLDEKIKLNISVEKKIMTADTAQVI